MHLDAIIARNSFLGGKDLKSILLVAMENQGMFITSILKIFLLLKKI